RLVVEPTLAGGAEHIKERTLGIEIFGRDADYDTATDPIVRVTAAEIRKRVAQYYQEPSHSQELPITLPSGSYAPKFRGPSAEVPRPPPVLKSVIAPAANPLPAKTVHGFPASLLRW